ncbi:hypothetical protein bAD24_III10315 [Burkholderia sp. AD24]|nr:hypothetical protein bAD24_III10315 [Burkholderia sp. AD24]
MSEIKNSDRPWSSVTALLSGITQSLPHAPSSGKTLTAASCRRIKITILEREGPLRATVSWSDPTTCCYWEQLWRRGRARKRGFCALTGAEIAPSDEVFRPSSVAPVPVNINAMILASVLDAISLADEA